MTQFCRAQQNQALELSILYAARPGLDYSQYSPFRGYYGAEAFIDNDRVPKLVSMVPKFVSARWHH